MNYVIPRTGAFISIAHPFAPHELELSFALRPAGQYIGAVQTASREGILSRM